MAEAVLEVKMIQALFTGILGVAAWMIAKRQVGISHRQAETAAAKLKLDLYEKRYAVYHALTQFLESLQRRFVLDEEYYQLLRGVSVGDFLFGDEWKSWLRSVLKDCREMNNANGYSLDVHLPDEERQKYA